MRRRDTHRSQGAELLERTTEQARYRGYRVLKDRAKRARDLEQTELGEVTHAALERDDRASLEQITAEARSNPQRQTAWGPYLALAVLLLAIAGIIVALIIT